MTNLTRLEKLLLEQFSVYVPEEETSLCLHCLNTPPQTEGCNFGIGLRIFVNGEELDAWWKESYDMPENIRNIYKTTSIVPPITIGCKARDTIFLWFSSAYNFDNAVVIANNEIITGDQLSVKSIFNMATEGHRNILGRANKGLKVNSGVLYYCIVPNNASGKADIYMSRYQVTEKYRIGTIRGWVKRG